MVQHSKEVVTTAHHVLPHGFFPVPIVVFFSIVVDVFLAYRSNELVAVRADFTVRGDTRRKR